jgi:MFS family permease
LPSHDKGIELRTPVGSSEISLDRAVARTRRRLVPLLLLMYVVSFLDRANISFAKQALQASVGISESSFALAAGLFFISYSLCGFPSNLILHKVGAKLWLATIMVSWGLVSMATMFVKGSHSLYLLRLLLGVTEAGFFPGVILYLTYWFPNRVRGQILGLFYLGIPAALILGSPLSGLLLEMNPVGGLQNWQWMFLVEGFMAVAVGALAYWYLDNRPSQAAWLPAEERRALDASLSSEATERRSGSPANLLATLCDLRVLHFVLIYFMIQVGVYGAVFYLPSEVSAFLHKPAGFEVGLVSAIPWICALAAVFWLPRLADSLNKHRQIAALTLVISGCASLAFPTTGPRVGLLALSIAVSGLIAIQPLFWTFPTGYLADRAAAGGIALVNLGNLGGFIAPNVKVWAEVYFGSQRAGLYLLAGLTVLNAGSIALIKKAASQENVELKKTQ